MRRLAIHLVADRVRHYQLEKHPMKTPRNTLEIWLLAARPKTLPAAAAPVIVGTAAAIGEGAFRPGPALGALAGALLLQVATNLANDLFDFQKGADSGERLGPLRVTQAGLLTPNQVRRGMLLVLALVALIGVYLITVSGWPILAVGLLAMVSAVAYTGGPFPLGYHGLGELFVFLFFGLAAVCGTYYVQAGTVSTTAWWAAAPMGLLSSAILVVNNLRDMESDRAAGKRTLAVRFGANFARAEYAWLVRAAYLMPALMWAAGAARPWVLLSWLSFPLTWPLGALVFHQSGRVLNKALADTARLELAYSLCFAVGLIL